MAPNNKFLFSETNFNRFTKIRENSTLLDNLIKDPNTKHILLWQGKILFDCSSSIPRLGLISHDNKIWNDFSDINILHGNFVGFQDNTAIFYHNIPDWNELEVKKLKVINFSDSSRNHHPSLPNNFAFCELRSLMTLMTKSDATILASVKGIYEWNKKNNFCCRCGSKTNPTLSGWEKICNNCNLKHFPRTDPVVIMMVYRKEKALLGRSAIWPKGMFSCLAGFMEPGESIETAVARETYEETGVSVKNVKYIASQPWPFPASLMIGCTAEATSDKLSVDTDELEEARWFHKEEIRQAMDCKAQWWPAREGSIARFLISQWVDES